MTNAQCYVSNHTLHTDLRIPYVRTVFQERTAKHRTVLTTHRTVLTTHPNPTIKTLLQQTYNRRTTDVQQTYNRRTTDVQQTTKRSMVV
jgi:hypothetical protein